MEGVVTSEGLIDGYIQTLSEEYYIEPANRYFDSSDFHSIIYMLSDVVFPKSKNSDHSVVKINEQNCLSDSDTRHTNHTFNAFSRLKQNKTKLEKLSQLHLNVVNENFFDHSIADFKSKLIKNSSNNLNVNNEDYNIIKMTEKNIKSKRIERQKRQKRQNRFDLIFK